MSHLSTSADRADRIADGAAVLGLVAAAVAAALVFRDFGLGWDDYTHSQYGDLLLRLYGSGFTDQRALSFVNLYEYGGGFDMLAALVAKVLPLDLFETRRLVGAAVGVVGLFATWRLARRVGGPVAGLIALALLATCPLFVGHMFMNPKDGPFAVAMAILMLGLVRVFEEYPSPTPASGLLFGIGAGLAIGTRILGGMAVVYALVALAVVIVAEHRSKQPAFRRAGRFVLALLPWLVLAYAVMAVVWPWSVINPLNPIRALEYFSVFFEKPWRELFAGQLILVPDMPRRYVPQLFALKLPELMLGLGIAGCIGAIAAGLRSSLPPQRRAVFGLLALAGSFPIALAVAERPAMYNGIRHFVFVVPAIAVLGGLAGAWLIRRVQATSRAAVIAIAAVIAAGCVEPVIAMVRLHPYEYTHFNLIAGGAATARDRYMLDYWGLSFKQASQALLAHVRQTGAKPPGQKWRVAVCGPHAAAQEELGPDFTITWDPQGADFAMTLGEFYCTRLDAPVVAEIVRDGTTYARIYDLAGKSFTSLLTIPAP